MLKKLVLTLCLTSALWISGCSSKLPEGMGRWPKIDAGEKVEFSAEEMAVLTEFAKANPEIARKIIGRNNAQAAAIKKFNEKAREVNRNILKTVGFSEEEVNKLEP